MARPRKIERNREIVQRLESGWTYRQLSAHYNLDVKTIWEIVQRERLLGVVDKRLDTNVGDKV